MTVWKANYDGFQGLSTERRRRGLSSYGSINAYNYLFEQDIFLSTKNCLYIIEEFWVFD